MSLPADPRARCRWALAAALGAALLIALPRSAATGPEPSIDAVFAPSGEARKAHAFIERELKSARKSVEVAMFIFTSGRLAEALIDAKRNGCAVRVLMDARSAKSVPYSKHTELARAGVEVKLVKLGGSGVRAPKFHHKYCLIDGATLLTGSYNWSVSGDENNHENLVRIRHRGLARAYAGEFERVWRSRKLASRVR